MVDQNVTRKEKECSEPNRFKNVKRFVFGDESKFGIEHVISGCSVGSR